MSEGKWVIEDGWRSFRPIRGTRVPENWMWRAVRRSPRCDGQMITSRDMVMAEAQVKNDLAETAPPRLRHRILQAGGWAGVGFVLDKVIAAIQLMVVARLLGPADFGVMAASATIVLAFMTISELGLESALIA